MKITHFVWPGRYFISHAYRDAHHIDVLEKGLPRWAKPFRFPPIRVRPDQMVSNPIMAAIRDCDGLIYLKGGASDTSFWVAMERDVALREEKRVYSYDPGSVTLSRDKSQPLELKVFHAFSRPDSQDLGEIPSLMDHRHFDRFVDPDFSLAAISWREAVEGAMRRVKAAGNYVIIYWSAEVKQSDWIKAEFDMAMREYPDRVLVAQLDDTPLPAWIIDRVNPDRLVQLMSDRELSQLHKIDDLIVRLYWLVYKNTRGNEVEFLK